MEELLGTNLKGGNFFPFKKKQILSKYYKNSTPTPICYKVQGISLDEGVISFNLICIKAD